MIRSATQEDALEIAMMLSSLHAQTTMNVLEHDLAVSSAAISGFVGSGQFVQVIESNGDIKGAFIGLLVPSWFGKDKIAVDLAWYVEEENRGIDSIRLVKNFVQWAKDKGAKQVRPGVSTANEAGCSIYRRLGFKDVGASFYLNL